MLGYNALTFWRLENCDANLRPAKAVQSCVRCPNSSELPCTMRFSLCLLPQTFAPYSPPATAQPLWCRPLCITPASHCVSHGPALHAEGRLPAVPGRPPAQQQSAPGGRRACRQPGGRRAEASGRRSPAQGELTTHDPLLKTCMTHVVVILVVSRLLNMVLSKQASACDIEG